MFLDLPLAIKPFGSQQAYSSVIEALKGFVQFENLEGSNQYSCSTCNKKCNAHKVSETILVSGSTKMLLSLTTRPSFSLILSVSAVLGVENYKISVLTDDSVETFRFRLYDITSNKIKR